MQGAWASQCLLLVSHSDSQAILNRSDCQSPGLSVPLTSLTPVTTWLLAFKNKHRARSNGQTLLVWPNNNNKILFLVFLEIVLFEYFLLLFLSLFPEQSSFSLGLSLKNISCLKSFQICKTNLHPCFRFPWILSFFFLRAHIRCHIIFSYLVALGSS